MYLTNCEKEKIESLDIFSYGFVEADWSLSLLFVDKASIEFE